MIFVVQVYADQYNAQAGVKKQVCKKTKVGFYVSTKISLLVPAFVIPSLVQLIVVAFVVRSISYSTHAYLYKSFQRKLSQGLLLLDHIYSLIQSLLFQFPVTQTSFLGFRMNEFDLGPCDKVQARLG